MYDCTTLAFFDRFPTPLPVAEKEEPSKVKLHKVDALVDDL